MLRRGIVNQIAAASTTPMRVRLWLLRRYGVELGEGTTVLERCFFGGPDISFGAHCFVNVGCVFDNSAPIVIGAHCGFGPEVLFVTTRHVTDDPARRTGPTYALPTTIGAGTGVGARAIILAGVTIGPGCVIAAGAVVKTDCAANGVYAGVPARRIRDLEPSDRAVLEAGLP